MCSSDLVLAIVTAAAIWLALGPAGGLYGLLRAVAPGLGIARYPIKFMLLPALTLPLLAGIAAARLRSRETGETRVHEVWKIGVGLGCIGIGLAWFTRANPLPYDQWEVSWRNALWRGLWCAGFLWAALRAIKLAQSPMASSAEPTVPRRMS